jgi:predicted Zn-dependent protease
LDNVTNSFDDLINAAAREIENCNWSGLHDVARQIYENFPDHAAAFRYHAKALVGLEKFSAADEVLKEGVRLFPADRWLAQDYAELAARRGDLTGAAERWKCLRQRFWGNPGIAIETSKALRKAGLLLEPDQTIDRAAQQFPRNFIVISVWVNIALERRDWRSAGKRSSVMRRNFPRCPLGYHAGGEAMRQLGLCDEADAIIEAGLAHHPSDLALLTAYAHTAARREDWALAESRWRAMLERNPGNLTGALGLAASLQRQKRLLDAEEILLANLKRFPQNAQIAERYVGAASQRGDWQEVADRCQQLLLTFPQNAFLHRQLAVALKRTSRADDAERILSDAMLLMPDDLPIAIEHAWCAHASRDWPAALIRWRSLAERFPDAMEIKEGLMQAELQAADHGIQVNSKQLPNEETITKPVIEKNQVMPKDIFSQFESLGEHCEFGLVQREYGLEPISLFRWVSISLSSVTLALEEGLTDFGNPKNVSLKAHAVGSEYMVRDSLYRFGMHTFVKEGSIPEEVFFSQQCRRLRFLARKLVEDLQNGERIFVHFRTEKAPLQQVLRLHQVLRRYGNTKLLYVQLTDSQHAPGTVTLVREGLMIGYIDRFGKVPPSGWDIAFDTWLTICRGAIAIVEGHQPQPD